MEFGTHEYTTYIIVAVIQAVLYQAIAIRLCGQACRAGAKRGGWRSVGLYSPGNMAGNAGPAAMH